MEHFLVKPIIVIDGVFFQINQTGIARVWSNVLKKWQQRGWSKHIIVIDRAGTAPQLEGILYYSMPAYDYQERASDSERLQFVCNKFKADLFISTYYTTPLWTSSILMVHDMIPEVIGLDLNELCWKEKHYSILYATRYIAVSQNTASDLLRLYPHINKSLISVVLNGVDEIFMPATNQEIIQLKEKLGIQLPYFLIVGSRMSLNGYKNAILFFKALNQWNLAWKFSVVCMGGEPELEAELSDLVRETRIHLLQLEDIELRTIYSGAIALIYPSLYEGFGLPIVEAIACGCPVITCRNSSLPEVAEDAAIYVDEYDTNEMIQALEQIQIPEVRQRLIQSGFKQAKKFSSDKMAEAIFDICMETAQNSNYSPSVNFRFYQLWQEFRKEQFKIETLSNAQVFQQFSYSEEFAKIRIELELAKLEVETIKASKFWKLHTLWFKFKSLFRQDK